MIKSSIRAVSPVRTRKKICALFLNTDFVWNWTGNRSRETLGEDIVVHCKIIWGGTPHEIQCRAAHLEQMPPPGWDLRFCLCCLSMFAQSLWECSAGEKVCCLLRTWKFASVSKNGSCWSLFAESSMMRWNNSDGPLQCNYGVAWWNEVPSLLASASRRM